MPLVSFGVSHKTASLKIRECLVFEQERASSALSYLVDHSLIQEGFILSTCNRTELYVYCGSPRVLFSWLRDHLAEYAFDLDSVSYSLRNGDALKHLLKVAVGLDSMALGEPQIFGQLKKAFFLAEEAGFVGSYFKSIMPSVFSIAKRVRTATRLGENPVTMVSAVLQSMRQWSSDLSQLQVLLVGVGEMTVEMLTCLQKYTDHLVVANRTVEKARHLCQGTHATAISLAEVASVLPRMDVVITATSCPDFILTKSQLHQAMDAVGAKPRLLIDLAVPRDVDPQVRQLPHVTLLDMDAIEALITANRGQREVLVQAAEELIASEALHLFASHRITDCGGLIRQFRGKYETLRDQEVADALDCLRKGDDPTDIIIQMGRSLMNKALHEPTLSLRQAAYANDKQALNIVKELFNLS